MMHARLDACEAIRAHGGLGDRLDALAALAAEIDCVAYFDIAAGTVLGTSSVCALPQERLDALCATATQLFAGPLPARHGTLLARSSELVLFRRPEPDSPTVLSFVFDPWHAPASARAAADRALEAWHAPVGPARVLERA